MLHSDEFPLPAPRCASAFSGSAASSFVRHSVAVIGGIFAGIPAISLSIVTSHRPSILGPCASSAADPATMRAATAMRRFMYSPKPKERRSYPIQDGSPAELSDAIGSAIDDTAGGQ